MTTAGGVATVALALARSMPSLYSTLLSLLLAAYLTWNGMTCY